MPFTPGNIRVVMDLTETLANDFGNAEFKLALSAAMLINDGTGAGQANRMYSEERTIASGAADPIDLAAGPGINRPFGQLLTITEIVAVLIINRPLDPSLANTTNLVIGAGAAPITNMFGATAHTVTLRPGGIFLLACPAVGGVGTVTPTTADTLTITNAAGAANTYQIVVIGRQ